MGQFGPGQQCLRDGEPDGQCDDCRSGRTADDRPEPEGAAEGSSGTAERSRRIAAAQKTAAGTARAAEGRQEMSQATSDRRTLRTVSSLWLSILAAAIVAAGADAGEQPPPAPVASAFPYELSISGLDRPVRVRFSVTVNGKPWLQNFNDIQRRYRQALYAQLDADRDGKLSAE